MRPREPSVPVLAREELSGLSIVELSIRKGRLLHLPLAAADAERRRAWQRSPVVDPNSIDHREDPRWLPQWLAAREEAWRRRKEHVEPIWCVVANVVREQSFGLGGAHTRIGTRTLRGGARVFIIDARFGLGELVIAIARFRGSGPWIRTDVRVDRLERLRTKLAYEPSVIDACFMHWGRAEWTEKDARAHQSEFERWQRKLEDRRERARRGRIVLPARHHEALGRALGKHSRHVDLRLGDGRVLLGVPMSVAYFADAIDFDPDQIVEIHTVADPPDDQELARASEETS